MKKHLIREEIELLKKLVNEITALPEVKRSEDAENAEEEKELSPDEIEDKVTNTSSDIIKDYKSIPEESVLTFPMKYALVGGSAEQYVSDMKKLFNKLRFGKKKFNIQKTIDILAPGIPREYIGNAETFIKALTGEKRAVSQDSEDDREYQHIQPSIKDMGQGEDDIASYEKTGASRMTPGMKGPESEDEASEKLKTYYTEATRGDEKAKISYDFSTERLTPKGFWQLQFLARTAQGKAEEKFLQDQAFVNPEYGNHTDAYIAKSVVILESFYKAAIAKASLNLTGRFRKHMATDVEFQNHVMEAWDKVKDALMSNKYDSSRNNFGAFAFTVAKNAIIDIIRKFTDYDYDPMHARDVIVNNNLNVWDFRYAIKKMHQTDSRGTIQPKLRNSEEYGMSYKQVEGKDGSVLHRYIFQTPEDAAHFFQDNASKSLFGSLAKRHQSDNGYTKLADSGAIHSVKKFAGYQASSEAPAPEFDKQKTEDDAYARLWNFAKNKALGVSGEEGIERAKELGVKAKYYAKDMNPLPKREAHNEEAFRKAEELGYDDKTISYKYKIDAGKLMKTIMAPMLEGESTKRLIWSNKIPAALRRSMAAKTGIPAKAFDNGIGKAVLNKPYKDKASGKIYPAQYYDPETGKVWTELEPFTKYDDKKVQGQGKAILNYFNGLQKQRIDRGELAFQFSQKEYDALMAAANAMVSIGSDKRSVRDLSLTGSPEERNSKRKELSMILNSIFGTEGIMLEVRKIKRYMALLENVKTKKLIKESLTRIKSKLLK